MASLSSVAKSYSQRLFNTKINRLYNVNEKPLIVMGNQKSGTTVVASLLGKASGKTVTIDRFYQLKNQIEIRRALFDERRTFESFVDANRYYFSFDVIKDPNFIFLFEDIAGCFPEAKLIFISRDPRDNIRSILNRLQLPGDLDSLSCQERKEIPEAWNLLINGELPSVEGDTYIENLAYRWNVSAEKYLTNQSDIELIRYEDFLADKSGSIVELAEKVDLEPTTDISKYIDIQYQPRGDRNVSWLDFFGARNLRKIENICFGRMSAFNYTVS